MRIRLTDGTVIDETNSAHVFPALRGVLPDVAHACEVCPVVGLCRNGNEVECRCLAMFRGFSCSFAAMYYYQKASYERLLNAAIKWML